MPVKKKIVKKKKGKKQYQKQKQSVNVNIKIDQSKRSKSVSKGSSSVPEKQQVVSQPSISMYVAQPAPQPDYSRIDNRQIAPMGKPPLTPPPQFIRNHIPLRFVDRNTQVNMGMPTQNIFTQTKTPVMVSSDSQTPPPLIYNPVLKNANTSSISLDDFNLDESVDDIVDIPIKVVNESFIEYDLPFTKQRGYQDIHSPHNEFFADQSEKEVNERRRSSLADIDASPNQQHSLQDLFRQGMSLEKQLREIYSPNDNEFYTPNEKRAVSIDDEIPHYETPTVSSSAKRVIVRDEITPTIINPLTKRRIKVGGTTYKNLVKEGIIKK